MEKQPTQEELETARARAQADAEERFAYEDSGREPGAARRRTTYAYAPEDVQAEYARVYEETLSRLRKPP